MREVVNLNYSGKTHVGLRRKDNQDSYLIEEKDGILFAVVCDGIGGGNAGDVASKMAVHHLRDCFFKMQEYDSDSKVKHWLETTIQEANDLIFMQSTRKKEQKGMGTTLVGILQYKQATYIFNVGDSRTYGLYEKDFLCLTEDHSYVASLLKRGEVSIEEAMHHPNRNVLTNALGIWDSVKVDINKIKDDYKVLLICSDGLHGYVSETLIQRVLSNQQYTPEEKVDALIQHSLDAGGYDNVSVIVIEKAGAVHE